MTKTDLVDLSSLLIRSRIQQLGAWATQKNTHHRVTDILSSLGQILKPKDCMPWVCPMRLFVI